MPVEGTTQCPVSTLVSCDVMIVNRLWTDDRQRAEGTFETSQLRNFLRIMSGSEIRIELSSKDRQEESYARSTHKPLARQGQGSKVIR